MLLTLNIDQFAAHIRRKRLELDRMANNELPVVIGKTSVDVFKKNFHNQAWGQTPWQEVQRRTGGTAEYKRNAKRNPARTTRKILTGDTGDLGRSIQYKTEPGKAIVYSDLVYAPVHNWGLRAGRGAGFTMPQRQFIGSTPELIQEIDKQVNNKLNNLFK